MKNILISILLFIGYTSFSQCDGFQWEGCELPFDWPYELNSQSIGTGIFPGQAFRIKTVLYEGNDYYIGFCNQDNNENTRVSISFDEKVLDDSFLSVENEDLKYMELSIQSTQIATIVVKLNKTQNIAYKPSDLKCLGIIIGNKITEE